jgi:tetratricopeptide (TPR) repeat protein
MGTQAGDMSAGAGPASVRDPAVEELIRVSEALNADCRFEAADHAVIEAMRIRTDDVRTAQQYALLALQRGDWREAALRAVALRAAYPHNPAGYRCGIEAENQLLHIGKAMELQRESARRFPDKSWPHVHAAMLAELSQNFDMTERRWEFVCKRFPSESAGWRDWAISRMHAGRLEAAETVLAEALTRFPDDPGIHSLWPLIATRRGRNEEIEARWRRAAERFPNDPKIAQGHAEAPVAVPQAKRWDCARTRYQELNRKFPEFAMGYLRHVQLLARMGEIDAAAELATAAQNLFRDPYQRADITLEQARILDQKGDVSGAKTLLETLLNEAPNSIAAYVALSNLLGRQSRYDEAEAVCKRAIARFKFRAPPLIEYAKIATSRGDLEEALKRWKRAYYFVPRDPTVDSELFIARLAITDKHPPNSEGDGLLEVGRPQRSGPLTNLMMKFESLGAPGGGGCEVGLVQRKFGAEPIGLLRWAAIEPDDLILALRDRFEGLGTREQTVLTLPGKDIGQTEYNVFDQRFKIGMHTWVMHDEMEAEKLLEQWCVRLQFLRRKLIADLESAGKIFVYKPGAELTDSQIEQLNSALRGYGDSQLLLIQIEDSNNSNGVVRRIMPGIMVGYIDRLNWEDPDRPASQPSFASWARLCANALALCAESKD